MPPIVSTVDIARPPGEVFAYVTDPTRFPEWQRDVVQVQMDSGEPGKLGSRFRTTRRIGRSTRTMTQEVTEVNAPHTWMVRGLDGPIRPNASVTVEPLKGGQGSRVTFALTFDGRGMGAVLAPMVRRMAARGAPLSYRNLQELLARRGTSTGG
jgi:uncharacterized protein YndB with AHSA1/START domain